ncbi:uncharacterized protein LOC127718474 [Mytilus californianus]|uniref:uncharacterized protein LOC127718474 n=1 Tax=Mytilus californianus TaxID=6549 RepID=UPI00224762E7|nr:uncharacterized protein LOC127718474 [Mytilus californianus]
MLLYRLLRDGENVSGGIVARNSQSTVSLIDHIASKQGTSWWGGTKYISTCHSLEAVMSFAINSRAKESSAVNVQIAEIDTSTLPSEVEVIDLSSREKRRAYLQKEGIKNTENTKFRRFEDITETSKEVTIASFIPPHCIKLISKTITSNLLFRLLRDEEVSLIQNGDSITAKSLLSETSVVDHVTSGLQSNPSKYISTCTTVDIVKEFAANLVKSNKTKTSKTFHIAKIDVNKLIPTQFEIIDLCSDEIRRKQIMKEHDEVKIANFHKVCDKYKVVLLVGHVPSRCIGILKLTYNSAKDDWSE